MARILLAWELGNGIGYCQRLIRIADQVAALGHEPHLVLYDLVGPAHLLKACLHPVYQAPVLKGKLNPDNPVFAPTSFADILICDQLGDPHVMTGVLSAWDRLLDHIKPDLVVGEYAPAVMLASYGRVQRITLGTGFIASPTDQDLFPTFRSDRDPFGSQEVLKKGIDAIQRQRGRPVASRLTDYFRGVTQVTYCYPVLDPYAKIRGQDTHGPLDASPPLVEPPNNKRFHAYLTSKYDQWKPVLTGLLSSGLSGTLYMPDVPDSVRQAAQKTDVQVMDDAPPLAEAIAASDIVIHHGGIDTAQMALIMGRPQVMFPRYIEQRITADALSKQGIAVHPSVAQFDHRLILGSMKLLLDDDFPFKQNAMILAQNMRAQFPEGSLQSLIGSIDFHANRIISTRKASAHLPTNLLS